MECPPWDREFTCSIPCQVIPQTITIGVIGSLLSTRGLGLGAGSNVELTFHIPCYVTLTCRCVLAWNLPAVVRFLLLTFFFFKSKQFLMWIMNSEAHRTIKYHCPVHFLVVWCRTFSTWPCLCYKIIAVLVRTIVESAGANLSFLLNYDHSFSIFQNITSPSGRLSSQHTGK